MSKKRILHKLRLTEISAVDKPCQEHARVTIMKRDDERPAAPGVAGEPAGSSGNHEGAKAMAKGEGDDTRVSELEKHITELEDDIDKLTKELESKADDDDGGNADEVTKELRGAVEELTKRVDELTERAETAEGERVVFEILAKMNDAEKEFFKAFPPKDKEKAVSDMEDMTEEERKKYMKEMMSKTAADETVKIGEQTIRKSVVGDDVFAVLKKQSEDIARNQEEIAKVRAEREFTDLKKRADEDFSHVPGTTEERARLLQVMTTMDEPLRKSMEAILTQSEKLAKAGFDNLGHSGGRPEDQDLAKRAADFETTINKIASIEKVPRSKALQLARQRNPELFKAYQEHGEQISPPRN